MKLSSCFYISVLMITGMTGCDAVNPYLTDSPLRVPKVSVLTPTADQEAVDGSFQIKVAFEKVLVDDTWNLYYVSDSTPTLGAAIGTGLPVTARTITWDTSLMPSGRYYIYAELSSLDTVITSSAPGSIVVSHGVEEGNSAPVVSLGSPNGGETLIAGETTTIRYSATDADSDSLTYKIEISADDGVVWETIVEGHTATTYDWEIPAAQAKGFSYRLRVTATDSKTATATDLSNRNFAVL